MPWCLVGSEDDRAGRLRRGEEISGRSTELAIGELGMAGRPAGDEPARWQRQHNRGPLNLPRHTTYPEASAF